MQTAQECPLCGEALDETQPEAPVGADLKAVACPNCGPFTAALSLLTDLAGSKYSATERAVVSHALTKMQRTQAAPVVTMALVEQLVRGSALPDALARIDNLVTALATTGTDPGTVSNLATNEWKARIGAVTNEGTAWVFKTAVDMGLVEGQLDEFLSAEPAILVGGRLSARGWQRFAELQKAGTDSRRAFMAMKYGDAELDRVYAEIFRPAVKKTGFDLLKMDDEPQAGLIDDRLRVEIRRCRFLIADLSHGNPGAYWEAGFAEGLGRPVIYTCRRDVFEGRSSVAQPHFDTNHHATVVWDASNLERAAEALKAVIRNTLPDVATMQD